MLFQPAVKLFIGFSTYESFSPWTANFSMEITRFPNPLFLHRCLNWAISKSCFEIYWEYYKYYILQWEEPMKLKRGRKLRQSRQYWGSAGTAANHYRFAHMQDFLVSSKAADISHETGKILHWIDLSSHRELAICFFLRGKKNEHSHTPLQQCEVFSFSRALPRYPMPSFKKWCRSQAGLSIIQKASSTQLRRSRIPRSQCCTGRAKTGDSAASV